MCHFIDLAYHDDLQLTDCKCWLQAPAGAYSTVCFWALWSFPASWKQAEWKEDILFCLLDDTVDKSE